MVLPNSPNDLQTSDAVDDSSNHILTQEVDIDDAGLSAETSSSSSPPPQPTSESSHPVSSQQARRCFRARRNCMPIDEIVLERRIAPHAAECLALCKRMLINGTTACDSVVYREEYETCDLLNGAGGHWTNDGDERKIKLVKRKGFIYFRLIDEKFCQGISTNFQPI